MAQEAVQALVVDDDPLFTKLVASWLETQNFNVTTAGSAEAAIDILRSRKLNLLITDLKMDGLGGFGLIRTVLSDGSFPLKRIVVITGEGQTTEESLWLTERNIPILRKPFTLRSLQAAVDSVLQQS